MTEDSNTSFVFCTNCMTYTGIREATIVYTEGSWTTVECEGCKHHFSVTSDPKVADADASDEKERQ